MRIYKDKLFSNVDLAFDSEGNVKIDQFICDKCGLCCKYLIKSVDKDLVKSLLSEDEQSCKYYNDIKKTCNIYEDRPLICKVDDLYDKVLSEFMTKEDYYTNQYQCCKLLKDKYESDRNNS